LGVGRSWELGDNAWVSFLDPPYGIDPPYGSMVDGKAVAETVVGTAGEELAGQAKGHLQGVGTVVVVANGKLPELID